jgi:predicted DCC family thiol-disulfide oxidoreductase YuxK
MNVAKFWNHLFLEERPSIGLSFFRIPLALIVGIHVLPSFCHLQDNYFSTALKSINTSFFTSGVLDLVQKSPDGVVVFFVVLFVLSWWCFLIGLFSQISCIILTLCCYYFYALNSFHIGTLSWDILLVTMFLMCITNYHGDYFSIDALRRRDPLAYERKRPFFIQRLLQLQIASTFFYTGLYKISGSGNWLKDNPIYYLMNYPPYGVTKNFMLKEWMAVHSQFCYFVGLVIIFMELSLPFLLFNARTRQTAIYLAFVFHITLILTFDVPSIFFFLFPFQLLLFIQPENQVNWVNRTRSINAASPRVKVVFDGDCGFCRRSIEYLKVMDLLGKCEYIAFQSVGDLRVLHSDLTPEKVKSELYLITSDGRLYGGYFAFRQLGWIMPMLYPALAVMYFPGAGIVGSRVYRFIAQNRYLFHVNQTCKDHHCFRP